MNKKELIAAVAGKMETSNAEAARTLDTVMTAITEGVESGEVVLPGIGKLVVVDTAARSGVTRLGGDEKAWSKPAGKTVKLRLSKAGKELV